MGHELSLAAQKKKKNEVTGANPNRNKLGHLYYNI